MAKLSRKSWHYRFASLGTSYQVAGNLCPYVRQVIGGMFKFSAITFLLAGIIIGGIMGYFMIWNTGFHTFFEQGNKLFALIAMWGFLGAAITTLAALFFCIGGLHAWYESIQDARRDRLMAEMGDEAYWAMVRDKSHAPQKPAKPPGLIRLWFRAKHDKICPQLTFE